jgi:toxin ParE1/3/4
MSARKTRIVLTERAREDARNIQLYTLEQWGNEQAAAYDEAIAAALERLRIHPRIGKARDDLRPGLRSYAVEKHLILYRIEGDELVVQRIVHSRQAIERAVNE